METTQVKPESMMKFGPQQEHLWLQKLVGEWTYEMKTIMGSEEPSETFTGTEEVRSLGNLWVQCEGQGEMCGGPATTIMTLGYDPQKQSYVGTWIGSMMNYLWLYNGELDKEEQILTLNSEGPSLAGNGTIAQYKDVIKFKGDDHRVMTSHTLGDDGQWHQFMTALYHRKK